MQEPSKQKLYFKEMVSWIKANKPDKKAIARQKIKLCRLHRLQHIPTDIEIYLNADGKNAKIIRPFLQTKPVRTGSGVAVIATMTKPYRCPHGKCTFCPGGLGSIFGDVPMSYTGKEPSTMRAVRNDYDPYRIVFNRLEQYVALGQNCDKVEQIIQGGTFCAFPKKYQEEYVYYCFKAFNDFSRMFFRNGVVDMGSFKEFFELPGKVGDEKRALHIKEKLLKLREAGKKSLADEQTENETSGIRSIGLTVETKPDWGFAKHGLELLKLGATRVELGIQTIFGSILKATHRGHTLEDTKRSIADLRDLGFKLNFHMMPGLPEPDGTRISKEKDIAGLKVIFDDESFRPDMMKIYPCMVMPGTPLMEDYQKGIFSPISTKEAAEIIVQAKRYVPEYCRIMRVQRDIPTYVTSAGVDKTNLRQYVEQLAKEQGIRCRCIRCREIGNDKIRGNLSIIVREYTASNGKELFISMESDDRILGFLRLRFPPRSLHPSITKDSALIRELHVYGQAVAIGGSDDDKTQHKGIGKRLMARAEGIAKENGKDKMVVISGIGAREYYRKLGYRKEDCYMVKKTFTMEN